MTLFLLTLANGQSIPVGRVRGNAWVPPARALLAVPRHMTTTLKTTALTLGVVVCVVFPVWMVVPR